MDEIKVSRTALENAIRSLENAVNALKGVLQQAMDESEPKEATDGPVIFLEPRRQFIVSQPSERQLRELSDIGYLEYADEKNNYSFVVREQDLWRIADWRRVEEIIRRYAPGHPHFMEWAHQAWDKRNVFEIINAPDGGDYLVLKARSEEELRSVLRREALRQHITAPNQRVNGMPAVRIKKGVDPSIHRHAVKRILIGLGYPVQDRAALNEGEPIDIELRPEVMQDPRWEAYQREYVEQAYRLGGSVLTSPPGSGKTVVAIGLMCKCKTSTLILVPQRELAEQWRREIASKTTWRLENIGMVHGGEKRVAPITIATYQMAGDRKYRKLFDRTWGLIILDECHHLPADYYRRAADFQSIRRLGLSASPVREDSRERDIWALIGPPIGNDWASLFAKRYVALPSVELRKIPFPSEYYWQMYKKAKGKKAAVIAAMNPAKVREARRILEENSDSKILIFVQWVEHGREVARELKLPFVYGETPHREREAIYEQFKSGKLSALVISRVGNQGIDIPDADLAIMVSWHGGSRQEGTQRTGRIMRPKETAKAIYLVTQGTSEEDFARRQVQLLRQQGVPVRETVVGLTA